MDVLELSSWRKVTLSNSLERSLSWREVFLEPGRSVDATRLKSALSAPFFDHYG